MSTKKLDPNQAVFMSLVEKELQKQSGKKDRTAAIARVCANDPSLHKAYLLSVNAGNPNALRDIENRFAK